jgi:dipeptidyl aminopeptidase/acylaminoacyl peptidase
VRVRPGVIFAVVLAVSLAGVPEAPGAASPSVRVVKIHYRAHNGKRRSAYVVLPAWYGPKRHPRLPVVISPHGRGISGRANARLWGALPARGGFAVISPDGQGRVLGLQSWGALGQIDDLARMPRIARAALPWLHVDRRRIYAVGGSMGAQESLLLLARHPHLLAGVAAFDAVTDFALQYHEFPRLGCDKRCLAQLKGTFGRMLQGMARREVGGSPSKARLAWRLRSPITYVRRIATSHVPLELWWSSKDAIVLDQARQTKRLFDEIRRLNPNAPVAAYQGYWRHSAEMRASTRLPLALAELGLLPQLEPVRDYELTLGVRLYAAPTTPGLPQPRAAVDGEAWPPDRQV